MKSGAWLIDSTIDRRSSAALIISPHLDDAVISCGLTIQALRAAGWSVFGATVFTDAPTGPISAIARRFNATGDADAVGGLSIRRSEDKIALARLGAEALHFGFFDASLRKRADGGWLCEDYEDICRLDARSEPVLRARVGAAIEFAVASTGASLVMAPAAVGGHVDHRLVHAAVMDVAIPWGERVLVRWYEDLPYAFDEPSSPAGVPFCRAGESEISAKLDAVALYATQLHTLGETPSAVGWRARFRHHAYDSPEDCFVERVLELT